MAARYSFSGAGNLSGCFETRDWSGLVTKASGPATLRPRRAGAQRPATEMLRAERTRCSGKVKLPPPRGLLTGDAQLMHTLLEASGSAQSREESITGFSAFSQNTSP